jgi:hypothetical protein
MSEELRAYFSEKHLAERWNLSTRTLQRRRASGISPNWIRIGHRVLYPATEIARFESSLLVASNEPE